MVGQKEWSFIYKDQSLKFNELQFTLLSPWQIKSNQSQSTLAAAVLDGMQQHKRWQVKSVSNYFNFPNLVKAVQLSQPLYPPSSISRKCFNMKINHGCLKCRPYFKKQDANKMKVSKFKLSMCFSRRWRQPNITIYLWIHKFTTPQKNIKVRAHIINQRGLILQTLSNLQPLIFHQILIKMIKTHYSRVKGVVLICPQEGIVNLDMFQIFRQCEQRPNVMMITYKSNKSFLSLQNTQQRILSRQIFSIINRLVCTIFPKEQLIVCYNQQIKLQQFQIFLQVSHAIIKRQDQLIQQFQKFGFSSDFSNQKQLLLRLFAFYFNFIALDQMHPSRPSQQLHIPIMTAVTEGLNLRFLQNQDKNVKQDVHAFSNSNYFLRCPVCKNKNKVICKKCSADYNRSFALCANNCFQIFHKNKERYLPFVEGIKRKFKEVIGDCQGEIGCEFEEINQNYFKKQQQKVKLEQQIDEIAQIRSIQDIRNKWKLCFQKNQLELLKFKNNCGIGLINQSIYQKINYLQKTAQYPIAFTVRDPSVGAIIKKQEN